MDDKTNSDHFYAKLRARLNEAEDWPATYMYKFIVPTSNEKIAKIEQIFDHIGAAISTRSSSKGKYTSVTIEVKMDSADQVIDKYKEIGEKVEGVISL